MYLFNHFLKSKSKFNMHVFKNLYWKQLGRACRRLEEGNIGQGQQKKGVVGRVAREVENENLLENKTHFPENQASFQF